MQDYEFKVKQILGHIAVAGVLFCGCAYFLGYVASIAGFAIGLITGIIFFLILYHQVEKFADLPKENAVPYMRCGWLARLSVLIVMLVLVGHFSQDNIIAAIVGFFVPPVLVFINAIAIIIKQIGDSRETLIRKG
ncbi:MAG TPA: ATP synthase subunit I [Negativicutes bacterium]